MTFEPKIYVDYLRDLILTLSKDQKKDFIIEYKKGKINELRKDKQLFEILSQKKQYKASEICVKIYGSDKYMNAYHTLRKRLFSDVSKFVFNSKIQNDATASTQIMVLITLSNHLLDNNQSKAGWHYFQKAEDLALKNEQFDLLDNIYNAQIAQAHQPGALPLHQVIEKWKINKQKADEEERANIASTLIKHTLQKYRIEGEFIAIQQEIDAVLKAYDLNETFVNRPKLVYNLLSMIRSKALVEKLYIDFQQLAIHKYSQIINTVGFKPKDLLYKLNILYMIAHVCYRNRDFEVALDYVNEVKNSIDTNNSQFSKIFYPKIILLEAAINSYKGDCRSSISIIESYFESSYVEQTIENKVNMWLNLAVYYFQLQEYGKSLRAIRKLDVFHAESSKIMGKEWMARKHLIEIIVQYEKENIDIAYSLIKSFKKQHQQLLQLPIHHRSEVFVDLIEQFIDKPQWVASKDFEIHLNAILERWPKEREDLQAMAFYSWLKSKMLKRNYYEVLLETVRSEELYFKF